MDVTDMPRCRDCTWWNEAPATTEAVRFGRCTRAYKPKFLADNSGVEQPAHPLPNGAKLFTVQPANIWTYDDFGCVQFEARA